MDPRHHKIPYFVVSSGRKGSDTAVPYLQKLEKDIFLNKIPSGPPAHRRKRRRRWTYFFAPDFK
ncbi:hypothetical protein NC653_040871 [Populus alba x Populus x berolinensis]|uniref:Uncharacterized protein n=1 Tax=Populus alba x Populus x berolinensis TaxID=444605 RepID=A0AAD6L7F3_9ROSI|nr:hypothetical protein NC653_040871 [Populus alba x Populus x berolinensis]